MADKPKTSVPALDEALRILGYLAKKGGERGVTLTPLSDELSIPKSKAHALLRTLAGHGFVERDEERKSYYLGPAFLGLSQAVLDQSTLAHLFAPELEDISRTFSCTALFGVLNGGSLYIAASAESGNGIGVTIRTGVRYPAAWGAHGKVFDAFKGGRDTAKAREIRDRAYAVDIGEMQSGISAVASPVIGPRGKPIGAVLVVGTFPAAAATAIGERAALAATRFAEPLNAMRKGA